MPSVTFNNIPLRSFNAICKNYGYQDQITDPNDPTKTIPNPETKGQFARRVTINAWFRGNIRQAEEGPATQTASQTLATEIDGITMD